MPRKKKQAVAANYNLQGTWELHYVSYFLRVFKKLFNLKKAYTAELLEKELCYEAIQVQFGEEVAKVVEYLTKEEELGATSWEPVLEEQMCKNAVHPNILKGTDFSSLDPEQRLQLLKILVDLVREVREEEIAEFGSNLKSKSLRFKAVGKDKHENKYWTFGSSRLFREFSKPNSKRFESVCTTPSEWEGFILTLRPSPNKNEKELHKSLKHVWGKIKDHIQLAQLKMKGHLELSQMAVKEHFELKRHAEAIEAIESNLEKPKMTKLVKMTAKPSKPKEKDKDGLISPMLEDRPRPILQNGRDKTPFVKKRSMKMKTKKQDDGQMTPSKMKENFLFRNSNGSSKNEGNGSIRTKIYEDEPYRADLVCDKDGEHEPAISEELRRKIEMDDPGIDLSIFKPLGKRKCVIEMEERKGKSWYEGNEDATDEEVQQQQYVDLKEVPKKKKRKIKAPEPTIPDPPIINATTTSNRNCVFSTALANRGAYEVIIKGKFNTIIAYHQAQKWPTAYLQHHIHCEPFVPEELKNEPALYTSDDASVKSYKSSEDENMRPVNKTKKKPRKKVIRKFSDASASASVSSPASLATNHSSDRSEHENFTSVRNIEHSDHESLSSDRENLQSDGEAYSSERDALRTGNTNVFNDNKNSHQNKPNIKEWQKMRQLGMEQQLYQEYHRYLYNNNNRKMDMQFFPPGMPNYRPSSIQKGKNSSRGRKAQALSKPRPSPLNQPTSLSTMKHIPDELSDDDEDDESMASENEEDKEKESNKEKELQRIIDSPRAPETDFNKPSSEFSSEHPASPASSRHSLSDVSLQGKDRDKLIDRLTDSSGNASPITRQPPQAASVIANNKTSSVTPFRMSTPSETLSGSPRNSPQLSPFAAYRGRPATYPAEIVNPKPPTSSTPPKAIPDSNKVIENERDSQDFVSEILNNHNADSGLLRPTTLQLGMKESPLQQPQPPAYSNAVDTKSQKMMGVPRMSPQMPDASSVIQRPNPSPISVDNLCSPAIPMHQMKSPTIPAKSSSSPIFIHDIVNGNIRGPSPVSPALGNKSNGSASSNIHSVISPVIANRMHDVPPSRSRSSPVIQAYSSAPMNCSTQRIPSPVQLANLHMQRMPLHSSQPDPNLLSALYRQHRMPRQPASAKQSTRVQNSIVEEQTRRIPSMIHNQQAKAYQGLPHGMPKEASQLSQAFAQSSLEQAHAFHGLSQHNSQEGSRSIHGSLQGMPDSVKSHLNISRSIPGDISRSLLGLAHNSQDSSRSYLGMHLSGQEAARAQHSLPRPAQNSPRTHLGLSASSQDASRTISGMAQSAQEATRNVLGVSHNSQESPRTHPAASHSGQETSRPHHALPHIAAQELSRSHHPLSHVLHEQSRYPGMPHSFHHGLNRTLPESPHPRSLHEAQHAVRPSVQGHSFQQGLRNLSESSVGKSPPTQSLFHHAHGREFPSPSTGLKSYPASVMERTLLEHQHSRLLEHQQQARLLEQQQQTRKSFSVESLTASSDASDRSKGQCLNGQPTTPSALSRPGYSPSQRSHMFGHFPAYARGPSPEFFKLPPHVQQMYVARGALGPYMNFPHFKG